ncbi:hypothetical protein [Streptomyces sp. NPDC001781]
MTRQRRSYGYVYSGVVAHGAEVRNLDGTAWSIEPCDEARLRAVALKDVAESEGVPLGELDVKSFWFSEISAEPDLPHPCSDPFGPRPGPDPFQPRG